MGTKTGISWTNSTWNPIRGCSRVSEGCRFCYAETVARRFSGKGEPFEGLVQIGPDGKSLAKWNGNIRFVEKHLLDPLRWSKSRRIFVNSVSDLFHENVTDEMRDKIFAVMALASQHTFQILTKRPEIMLAYLTGNYAERIEEMLTWDSHGEWAQYMRKVARWVDPQRGDYGRIELAGYWEWDMPTTLPNVWLGVSVEDARVKHRIDTLRVVPAAVRFLSLEPLIGDIGKLNLDDISWAIVGGESGHKARPMPSQWADTIREQCEAAGVAYFHKQNGEWVDAGHDEFGKLPSGKIKYLRSDGTEWDVVPTDENADVITMKRVGRKRAGDTLYGKQYHEYPS